LEKYETIFFKVVFFSMEIDPMKKSTKNTFKKIQEDIYIVMEF